MRDPERITEFLDAVEEIWRRNPDLRFGQMLVGACSFYENGGPVENHMEEYDIMWSAEEQELLDKLNRRFPDQKEV